MLELPITAETERTSHELVMPDPNKLVHCGSHHVLIDNDGPRYSKHLSKPALTVFIPNLCEVFLSVLKGTGHSWLGWQITDRSLLRIVAPPPEDPVVTWKDALCLLHLSPYTLNVQYAPE